MNHPPLEPAGVLIRVSGADLSEVVATLAGAGFVLERPPSPESPVDWRLRRSAPRGADAGDGTPAWAGALPAGFAHEINNPLSAVIANLELAEQIFAQLAARTDTPPKETAIVSTALLRQLESEVKDALQAGRHVQQLVRDARAALHPGDGEPVDVTTVIDLAIRMASSQVRTIAHLVRDGGEVPRVRSTTLRLAQVFLNLIINAAQAIPAGQPERHQIRITTETDERGWAKVTVSDSGTGIAPHHLPRVFSPFFSTKTGDRGTGLGLPISQRIVEGLGGRIEIASEVGRGTTVTVRLPPSRRPA